MERDTSLDSRPSTSQMVDGNQPDVVGEHPSSSVTEAARQQQQQVSISRNINSGYERAERARTSHACEPCRERKTKCDGERPSCRRCQHTNSTCHYGYGKGWKKRKTAEDLTVTSRKLARYEELLNEIFPLVTDEVRSMIDQARQQHYGALESTDAADSATPLSSSTVDVEMKGNSPTTSRPPFQLPTSMTQSGPSLAGTTRSLPLGTPFDSSLSPTLSTASIPGIGRSLPEDSNNSPALRLPSITPHGFLVEEAMRDDGARGSEARRTGEKRGKEELPSGPYKAPRPG